MGWSRGGRRTTGDFSELDVRYLSRNGNLRPGTSSTLRWSRNGVDVSSIGIRSTFDSVVLSYKRKSPGSNEWKSEEYPVYLRWTPCNYGGTRPWFLCPAQGCGRRVAVLYGGGIFACRHCHGLNYRSQHEQAWDRALTRYQKIRVKLGGHPGDAYAFPSKPKGMHRRTYERWRMKANHAQSCSWPNWVYRLISVKA